MSDLFDGFRFTRAHIDEEARAWLIEFDDEPAAPERLVEFRAWLARSPLHRRAFERAAAAWWEMDRLAGPAGRAPRAAADPEREPGPKANPQTQRRPLGSGWLVMAAGGLAAALVLAAGLGVLLHASRPAPVQAIVSTYSTAIGQISTVSLADGSTVELNTASRLIVAYRDDARILRLVAGEAYFEVAPNPRRPFIVYAGRFSVTALGTAFAVHRLIAGVDLTVTRGHVDLDRLKTTPSNLASGPVGGGAIDARLPVAGGQDAQVVNGRWLLKPLDARSMDQRLAWRDGMLMFEDEPLTEVVAEISRYTPMKIVISDPSIQGLKVGGYFSVRDVGVILETLHQTLGIEVTREKDDTVHLYGGRGVHGTPSHSERGPK